MPRIHVSIDHITKGRPGECFACPIHLAFLEQGLEVKVAGKEIIYQGQTYPLPKVAIYFIDSFDNDRPVEPIEFENPLEK